MEKHAYYKVRLSLKMSSRITASLDTINVYVTFKICFCFVCFFYYNRRWVKINLKIDITLHKEKTFISDWCVEW